jgi:hypothetical protein
MEMFDNLRMENSEVDICFVAAAMPSCSSVFSEPVDVQLRVRARSIDTRIISLLVSLICDSKSVPFHSVRSNTAWLQRMARR